jgi:hypothetical protein
LTEWDRCAGWIQQALDEHGVELYTIDDIKGYVEEGEAVFWPGERCALVTQFHDFPRLRALNFWLAGGERDGSGLAELKKMHDSVRVWGKLNGCTLSYITGRPGWARALGYKPAWTSMSKEL